MRDRQDGEGEGAKLGDETEGKETTCCVFLKRNGYRKALRKSTLRRCIKTCLTLCRPPPRAICLAGEVWTEGLGPLKRSVKIILSGTSGDRPSHPHCSPLAPLKQASSKLSLCSTAPEWGPMIGSLGG